MKELFVTLKDVVGLRYENMAPVGSGRMEMSKVATGYIQIVEGDLMYEVNCRRLADGTFEFEKVALIYEWTDTWELTGERIEVSVSFFDDDLFSRKVLDFERSLPQMSNGFDPDICAEISRLRAEFRQSLNGMERFAYTNKIRAIIV